MQLSAIAFISIMEIVEINGIQSHLFSLKTNASEECESLLFIIPGSPGMPHFYIPFAEKLFQLGRGNFDVTVISHAGQSPGCVKSTTVGTESSSRDWYSLEDNITHKLCYLKEYVSTKTKLYIVAHSIGCWMTLQMLPHMDTLRVEKIILLFPTVEKLSQSPKCLSNAYFWSVFRVPITTMFWIITMLPEFIQRIVFSWYFHTTPPEQIEYMVKGAMNIDNRCVYNMLMMITNQMNVVAEPPLDIIDQHIDKLVFYYGTNDTWNVETSYMDMAQRYPGKDINLCRYGLPHAFVETGSDIIAGFVYSKLPL